MNRKNYLKTILVQNLIIVFLMAGISVFSSLYNRNIVITVMSAVSVVTAVAVMVIMKRFHISGVNIHVGNIIRNTDKAVKDSLINLPLPISVVEYNGAIRWYNSKFNKMFGTDFELFDRPISSIVPDINLQKLTENGKDVTFETTINSKHFKVVGTLTCIDENDDSTRFMVLFWIDKTDYRDLKLIYENQKCNEAIVLVDNYDDLMQNTPEPKKTLLLAEIEREIGTMAQSAGTVIKKYDRDRYIFMFQHQYLGKMIQEKFPVLENVKKISCGNKIPPTLSIGIGMGEDDFSKTDKSALAAIDMALGRGGDQAVIKNAKEFKFFGGMSRETEKHTKVKARVVAHALRELIKTSSKVMIMGHVDPDADALGSAIGILSVARRFGKEAQIVAEIKNKSSLEIMKKFSDDEDYSNAFITRAQAEELITKNTLLIVVDTHRKELTECPELLMRTPHIVVIDHHRKSSDFIDNSLLIYHEPYASSTCELVVEIIQYMGNMAELSVKEAEAIYAGIVMDTKNFTFKTGVRTFEAASYLKKLGVDTISVKKIFRSDIKTYEKRSGIVNSAEIYRNNIAISATQMKLEEVGTIIAQAADELINIDGIEASFVLCTLRNSIHISGRSLGKINVQLIMESLGGGGHMSVAGVQLHNVTVDEAIVMLKEAIDGYFEQN